MGTGWRTKDRGGGRIGGRSDKRESNEPEKDMNAIIIHAIELIRQRKARRLHFLFIFGPSTV